MKFVNYTHADILLLLSSCVGHCVLYIIMYYARVYYYYYYYYVLYIQYTRRFGSWL